MSEETKNGCVFCGGSGAICWGGKCGACNGSGKEKIRRILQKLYNAENNLPNDYNLIITTEK